MVALWVILGIIGLILFAYLIITLSVFLHVFHRDDKRVENSLHENDYLTYQPFAETFKAYRNLFDSFNKEIITIKSYDKTKLVGTYIEGEKKNKVVLMFHGYMSKARNDFSSMLDYYKWGTSFILVDQRGHYRSDGKYITFGYKERFDVKCWCKYIVERFGEDVQILLAGVSLGASTIMMASDVGLPKQVVGIAADCGFVSAKQEMKFVIRNAKIPFQGLLFAGINMWAHFLGGFDIDDIKTSGALYNSDIPLLLIHGDEDDFVPYESSVINFESSRAPIKYFETFKSAVHGGSYLEHPHEYVSCVEKFLKEIKFLD